MPAPGQFKETIENVRERFRERGYELLESEYKGADEKLRYRCPRHPDKVQSIRYFAFKQGTGCYYCGHESRIEKVAGRGGLLWKGKSELTAYLRNRIYDWKRHVLEAQGKRCEITGFTENLEVHHLIAFNILRDRILNDFDIPIFENIKDYSDEQLGIILEEVKKRQVGVVLHRDIHNLFHGVYGFDVTPEKFERFKNRYYNGEFEKTIEKYAKGVQ